MTSHPKLRMVPLALVCVVIVVMIGWLIYLQRQDERAAANLHALELGLADRAIPVHAIHIHGETRYTCTTKTGWIYTAPTAAELHGLCGAQS